MILFPTGVAEAPVHDTAEGPPLPVTTDPALEGGL